MRMMQVVLGMDCNLVWICLEQEILVSDVVQDYEETLLQNAVSGRGVSHKMDFPFPIGFNADSRLAGRT